MSEFNRWLQSRLTAHGYRVDVDGVIGGYTTDALREFQRAKRLKMTGTATSDTVEALRAEPGSRGRKKVVAPTEKMPPWAAELYRRRGLHESRDTGVLSRFLRIGKYLGDPRRLPWCGDAIESAVVKTLPGEPVPNNPFWAQGWKKFGVDAKGPVIGSIGVIRWSSRAGHVGVVMGYKPGRVLLLGGNQSNAITLDWFPESKFIAFRWPKSYPMRDYPAMDKSGRTVGLAGTR